MPLCRGAKSNSLLPTRSRARGSRFRSATSPTVECNVLELVKRLKQGDRVGANLHGAAAPSPPTRPSPMRATGPDSTRRGQAAPLRAGEPLLTPLQEARCRAPTQGCVHPECKKDWTPLVPMKIVCILDPHFKRCPGPQDLHRQRSARPDVRKRHGLHCRRGRILPLRAALHAH